MRGADVTQERLFVMRQTADYVPADHPLVAIREILNRALRDMDLLFESIYEIAGATRCPGMAAAWLDAASAVRDSQRAAVVRATGLQHAVSLVCRLGHGRRGMGSQHLHPQPRSTDRA